MICRAVQLGLCAGLFWGAGCVKKTAPPVAAPKAPVPVWKKPPELVINPKAMRAEIAYFASDRMKGRYTLSPQIEDAARWLVQRYRVAKIPSAVGKDYMHRYTLHVGSHEGKAPKVTMQQRGETPVELPASQIATVAQGAPGEGAGQVVFVGYGIESSEPKAQLKELSTLRLKGKVALLLAGTPGEIDHDGILARAKDIAELYDSKLQAHPNYSSRRRKELLSSARKAFYKILCSYIPREILPDHYFKIEGSAPASIRAQDLLDPLTLILEDAKASRARINQVPLDEKLRLLHQAGAAAAIVVKGPATFLDAGAQQDEVLPEFLLTPPLKLGRSPSVPAVYMQSSVAAHWLDERGISLARLQHAVDLSLRSHSVGIPGLHARVQSNLVDDLREVPNVFAMIPGTDLANEIVIVGAHFDHVGTQSNSPHCEADASGDEICNGADDNASGTVAILEIARAIKRSGVKPRRTLVFGHFSGEELGLFGSRAFVRDGLTDLSRVVAMINIDMIGRLGKRELKVGGLATSPQWEGLLDDISHHGIDMLYDASSTSRSDHASFVEHKVPSLFFFSGVHDLYHEPGDELESLDMPSYIKVTRIIAGLVSSLAQGAPISWSEPAEGLAGVTVLPGEEPRFVVKRVMGSAD